MSEREEQSTKNEHNISGDCPEVFEDRTGSLDNPEEQAEKAEASELSDFFRAIDSELNRIVETRAFVKERVSNEDLPQDPEKIALLVEEAGEELAILTESRQAINTLEGYNQTLYLSARIVRGVTELKAQQSSADSRYYLLTESLRQLSEEADIFYQQEGKVAEESLGKYRSFSLLKRGVQAYFSPKLLQNSEQVLKNFRAIDNK